MCVSVVVQFFAFCYFRFYFAQNKSANSFFYLRICMGIMAKWDKEEKGREGKTGIHTYTYIAKSGGFNVVNHVAYE